MISRRGVRFYRPNGCNPIMPQMWTAERVTSLLTPHCVPGNTDTFIVSLFLDCLGVKGVQAKAIQKAWRTATRKGIPLEINGWARFWPAEIADITEALNAEGVPVPEASKGREDLARIVAEPFRRLRESPIDPYDRERIRQVDLAVLSVTGNLTQASTVAGVIEAAEKALCAGRNRLARQGQDLDHLERLIAEHRR